MQLSFVDKNVDKLMYTLMQTLITDKNVDYTSAVVINEEILMQTEMQTSVVDKNVDIIGNSRHKMQNFTMQTLIQTAIVDKHVDYQRLI